MNNFREFQREYNDWLMHKQDKKEKYRPPYSSPAEMLDYMFETYKSRGKVTEAVITMRDYSMRPADRRIASQALRLLESGYQFKPVSQYVQHNDFREYSDYLMHFGILGMKWGIRRYQNPDGTLTAAGKKRYDKYMKKAEKYGTETKEDRIQKEYDQKKTVAEKYGFKGDDDMDGDFVNDKKDIVIDKDTIMSDKFMKQVSDFNKNYKDHDAIMRNAAVKKMAESLNVSESQMKKNIDKYGRPFIYMTDGKDGGISMTADYDIGDGNHVATVEYDPKTKKVYYVSMNG